MSSVLAVSVDLLSISTELKWHEIIKVELKRKQIYSQLCFPVYMVDITLKLQPPTF